jgi:hypothetical protein
LCTKIPGFTEAVGGPVEYLSIIYKYSLTVVGLVGFGLLVWNGINYIFQKSNYAKLSDIKNHITEIVFGIILLVFASILLNEIDPNILTNLKSGTEFGLIEINKSKLEQQYADAEKDRNTENERRKANRDRLAAAYADAETPEEKGEVLFDNTGPDKTSAENKDALFKLNPPERIAVFNSLGDEKKKIFFSDYYRYNTSPGLDFLQKISPNDAIEGLKAASSELTRLTETSVKLQGGELQEAAARKEYDSRFNTIYSDLAASDLVTRIIPVDLANFYVNYNKAHEAIDNRPFDFSGQPNDYLSISEFYDKYRKSMESTGKTPLFSKEVFYEKVRILKK